jgi:hypothetical protein
MSRRAQNRIYTALTSKHSPLIAAIIEVDVDQVKYYINSGVNVNETCKQDYNWLPMKWTTFVYKYGKGRNNQEKIYEIVQILLDANAKNGFDSKIKNDSYNFAPIIPDTY